MAAKGARSGSLGKHRGKNSPGRSYLKLGKPHGEGSVKEEKHLHRERTSARLGRHGKRADLNRSM